MYITSKELAARYDMTTRALVTNLGHHGIKPAGKIPNPAGNAPLNVYDPLDVERWEKARAEWARRRKEGCAPKAQREIPPRAKPAAKKSSAPARSFTYYRVRIWDDERASWRVVAAGKRLKDARALADDYTARGIIADFRPCKGRGNDV